MSDSEPGVLSRRRQKRRSAADNRIADLLPWNAGQLTASE